jgi:hypothetical protein
MSRIARNLGGGPSVGDYAAAHDSGLLGLLGLIGVGLVKGDFALDSVGELREVLVADHASEPLLGFEHPGRGPPLAHLAAGDGGLRRGRPVGRLILSRLPQRNGGGVAIADVPQLEIGPRTTFDCRSASPAV